MMNKSDSVSIKPSALNYANKNKICIFMVNGTGKNGTITLDDIKSYETSSDITKLIPIKRITIVESIMLMVVVACQCCG